MLNSESIESIDSKGKRSKCYNDNLEDYNRSNNGQEHPVIKDSTKDIKLVMELSAVDEIEDLHHHKSIEDECEVARIQM